MPDGFRRLIAHAIANRASANRQKPFTPVPRGGTGGRNRVRGALVEGAVVVAVTVTLVGVLAAVTGFGETV